MQFGEQLLLALILFVPMFLAYCITSLRFTRSLEEAFKDKNTKIAFWVAIIISILIFIIFCNHYQKYLYNHKYSIAMPTITGEFDIEDKFIKISGIKNYTKEQVATLSYSELNCLPTFIDKPCTELSVVVSGWGDAVYIFPYQEEYKIKYMDKNKILFSNFDNTKTGEIDLNFKTLIYTIKNDKLNNEVQKIEVITDNEEIEKLEKYIIKKYLKIKSNRH